MDPLREVYDAISGGISTNDFNTDISVLQNKWSETFNTVITQFANEANGFNEYFIFEGWGIDLEKLLQKIDKDKFIIIGMGYPKISPEEKLQNLLKHEISADWTSGLTIKEKEEIVKLLIEEDKYIKAQIDKFNIPFFDTSFDRDKVLKEAMEYLEKVLVEQR